MEKEQYRILAEFRYQIRLFLHFSETAAREAGLEPQQHQLLLAVKGYEGSAERPSIGFLADRLQIKHNTAVELIDRMGERDLIRRRPGDSDRRQVVVELTPMGEMLIEKLSEEHVRELSQTGPALADALQNLTAGVEVRK